MFEYTDLRDQLATYLTQDEVVVISRAYLLAEQAHEGQRRCSGEPYVTHPLEVARILANMRLDGQSIAAAILHDVIEDTQTTKVEIAEQFGEEVAHLVDGVSKLTQMEFKSQEEAQAENFRKMMLAMAQDIRVILIKLADRLHNMRTIFGLPAHKRRRTAIETLEIYAPIAARLGINNMRIELEDLGFSALYPMRYRILKESVLKARGNRKEIIQTIEDKFKTCLQEAKLSNCEILGREKHLYSLYKKMRSKSLSFTEVMDVYAFRFIVDSPDACYRVMGLIHSLYKPVPGRFKDYIAIPKTNGYQSLHTTLLGPYGVPIEAQIRTEEMERMAENGIASHWLYKTGEQKTNALEKYTKTREWVKDLLEIQRQVGSSLEFIESVKLDLYPDDVYVFTPKGKILPLPRGATPVDFAYAIHTAVGNTCVAAKIDRRLAPLSTRLLSGQTVEIVTASESHPNPAWLNFVVSGKARSHIRHWLKKQQIDQSHALGKRMLESAMLAQQASLQDASQEKMEALLAGLDFRTESELYQSIGLGQHMAPLIAQRLGKEGIPKQKHQASIDISGTEGMVVTYGRCCYPIPGDPIIGFLSAGRGLVVHTEHCRMIKEFLAEPEQCVHVSWARNIAHEFQVCVSIDVLNGTGVLAAISSVIADSGANITGINFEEKDDKQSCVDLILCVSDRKHLARIMRRLRSVSMVIRIARTK